jgi:hypothetical protein
MPKVLNLLFYLVALENTHLDFYEQSVKMFELYMLSQSEDNTSISQFNRAPFSHTEVLLMKVYMTISQDNGLQPWPP